MRQNRCEQIGAHSPDHILETYTELSTSQINAEVSEPHIGKVLLSQYVSFIVSASASATSPFRCVTREGAREPTLA